MDVLDIATDRLNDSAQFGHIDKTAPGARFKSRKDLLLEGLHGQIRAGIHFHQGVGAFSVVLSGGYEDDKDNGEDIIYTGEGGQGTVTVNGNALQNVQVEDQEWTRGNEALKLCMERRLPVRVIRGASLGTKWAPPDGYRYDGLYDVVSAESVQGSRGFTICQFHLRRRPGQGPIPLNAATAVDRPMRADVWKRMKMKALAQSRFNGPRRPLVGARASTPESSARTSTPGGVHRTEPLPPARKANFSFFPSVRKK